jgi:hypothetical protein
MNIFQENFEIKYNQNYRAKIIEINDDKKNGIYKCKVFPFMADIEDEFLPWATSTMTTKESHVNIYVDDWVWVFFENGDPQFPVIFSKCNIKDNFPDGSDGERPTFWDNFNPNTEIDETGISFNGEYGKVSVFKFGDKVYVYFDEGNQVIIRTEKGYFVFDDAGDYHGKMRSLFFTCSDKFNVGAETMKLIIGDNSIIADSQGVVINDNLKILNT